MRLESDKIDYSWRLDRHNWDPNIYDGVPLTDACEIALNYSKDQNIPLRAWFISSSRSFNTVTWKTSPKETRRLDTLILSDTVSPSAVFRGAGSRIEIELGSYILCLPLAPDASDSVQLDIYSTKLDPNSRRSARRMLESKGIALNQQI